MDLERKATIYSSLRVTSKKKEKKKRKEKNDNKMKKEESKGDEYIVGLCLRQRVKNL